MGAVDGSFQQGGGNSQLGCLNGPVFTGGRTDTHEGRTSTLHNRLDVCEVQVDEARGGDQVGNALNTREQNLVGRLKGVQHGDVTV